MSLTKTLKEKRLFFDGSMGALLQTRGELPPGEIPDLLNITSPDTILSIHQSYANAGCDIIKTNTFGTNALKLSDTGYAVNDVVKAAVALAKKAAAGKAYVALDIGPLGKLLAPFGELAFEEAAAYFSQVVKAGAACGADLILFETMNDIYEVKAGLLAAKEACDLPVFVTFTPDENGRLLTGGDLKTAACTAEALGADAVGLNCGTGPKQMAEFVPLVTDVLSVPVIISPNAGLPSLNNGVTTFSASADEFTDYMLKLAPQVHVLGGCCGTNPEFIEGMIKAARDIPQASVKAKTATLISSYGKTVELGQKPIIIGERINPTGKPRLKKALINNEYEYIYNEALQQVAGGAHALDINTGLAGIDEADVLPAVVYGVQSVTNAPLVIDTTNITAAERALRLYNGKPLFNSVNGKQESLCSVLPLVKKYGAAVIALLLDENGIPDSADGRLEIAKKIINAAQEQGIDKKDIVIDSLTMTIGTDTNGANVTLETVERVKNELGCCTVLGVSNVSFGLPERERINAVFFTLAMQRGLSAGIINPLSPALTDVYYTYLALAGFDDNCAAYISRFKEEEKNSNPQSVKTEQAASLADAVIKGLREEARLAAKALDLPPLDIINEQLIPALDKVGQDFEKGALFLPQLLMSAEAAGLAFDVIRARMSQNGENREKQGKIVLATVKGDIHDIGINIVKTLLENYNYEIIDLGKNVEPAAVLDAVIQSGARLAGLSALMTTTLTYMEQTIKLLKEKAPSCRVMVGGAVLTEEYAYAIGADYYSKDAIGSIRCAKDAYSS